MIAFDILREGKQDLTRLPLTDRRVRLEKLFDRVFRLKAEATGEAEEAAARVIRLSEQVKDDATAMHARAVKEKWEGLIAKDAASAYQPGRRSPAWRKIKLQQEQEFVIGGWTEPRQTRQHFGALLLGVHEDGRLKYAGHTGTGFDQKELARVSKLLKARETKTSPFSEKIKTNEPAHWVRPDLVAQIRFTEWTAVEKLRHPVYLGLRDDKGADEAAGNSAKGAEGAGGAKGAGAEGAEGAADGGEGGAGLPVRRASNAGQSGSRRTILKSSLFSTSGVVPRSTIRPSMTRASAGRPLSDWARASRNISAGSFFRPFWIARQARS